MSTSGPRLSRTSKGYAEAKFNRKTVHFGKSDDPGVHLRFAHFITAWIAAGRELTPEVRQLARSAPEKVGIAIAALVDQYLAHLHKEQDPRAARPDGGDRQAGAARVQPCVHPADRAALATVATAPETVA